MTLSIRVTHTVDQLDRDASRLPKRFAVGMAKVLRTNAREGNQQAKSYAKESSGKHGKHYPNAFSYEARGPFEWEYGPDESKPQGGMSFENGSVNQPAHNDLARSADVIGKQLQGDVSDELDKLFWG